MQLLPFLVVILTPTESATFSGNDISVSLRYHDGPHRGSSYVIPVEYRIANSTEMVSGFARFAPELLIEPSFSTLGILQDNITLMTDLVVVWDDTRDLFAYLDLSAIVPVCQDSSLWSHAAVFLRSMDFSSFVVFFNDRVNGTLILSPSDPSAYAYNRELFYTPFADDSTLEFSTEISVISSLGNGGSGLVNSISPSPILHARASLDFDHKHSIIPRWAMNWLIEEIRRIAIVQDRFVTVIDPADIELLPIIRFTPFGDVRSHIDMLPSEYLNLVGPGYRYELTVGGRGTTACVLGHNFLNMVVVHADYVNRRIGFGDPIAEVSLT